MVIEDDFPSRELLARQLRHHSHDVREAAEARGGLDLIRRERPDVVFTHLPMPAMDAFELAHRLRTDPAIAATPLIFYTGSDQASEARKLAAICGAARVLPKPSEPEVILAAVDAALSDVTGRRRAAAQIAERARITALVADVGRALTEGRTLREMLQGCTDALVEHLGAAFARIWKLSRDGMVLELQSSSGIYTHIDGGHSRVPIGKFTIGLICVQREPHLTNSVADDPRVGDQEWARREGIVAFAGYPLVLDDEFVGVIAMFAREALNDSVLRGLEAVAKGIAAGIERKRTEDELRRREERYRLLVEQSPDAIALHDGTRHLYVNPAAVALVGAGDAEELLACSPLDLIHPDDRAKAGSRMQRVIGERVASTSAAERIVRFDGQVRDVEICWIPIRDQGRPAAMAFARDLTERKRSERELRAALARARESDHLKGAVLAGMSDVIRTPLDVIVGFLDRFQDDFAADDAPGMFRAVKRASERLISTVRDVLEISRLETGKDEYRPVPLDLADFIAERVKPFETSAREKGLTLEVDVQEAGAVLSFDALCLSRALDQILDNAVEFTATGKIVVRLRRERDGTMAIEVSDTGAGVDEAYLPRLFESFSEDESGPARGYERRGVGLALAKRFLGLGGARVTATTAKGKGSTFTIRFGGSSPPE
ncbi:MAG: hypothetical protein QOD06_2072 [Candidatus Binatota bacterium]|nr:hypothetical protein [Candidatus Binatota bacterium]